MTTTWQIRDDLSDLGASRETNDIEGLRPSLLLAAAYERAKGEARELKGQLWRWQFPGGGTSPQVEPVTAGT